MADLLESLNIELRWVEFGHVFCIERLPEPRKIGATVRHFRLYDNGDPVLGWQWHNSLEGAIKAAQYLVKSDYSSRIRYLEQRVQELENYLARKESV